MSDTISGRFTQKWCLTPVFGGQQLPLAESARGSHRCSAANRYRLKQPIRTRRCYFTAATATFTGDFARAAVSATCFAQSSFVVISPARLQAAPT